MAAYSEDDDPHVRYNVLSGDQEAGKQSNGNDHRWHLDKTHIREWTKAYWPTVGVTAVGIGWAVQIAYTTPVLRSLGMSDSVVNYSWLAGPVTGIIVQPLVGVYSDYCTSPWGRRRVYMLSGALLTALGLLMFSNAEAVGDLLGDNSGRHTWGLTVAVLGLWFLDCSLNMAQGPMRALLTDTISKENHLAGNAFFAAHIGLGYTLGYSLGAVSLVDIPVTAWLGTNVRALYTIAALVVVTTVALTCAKTHERQHHLSYGDKPPSASQVLSTVFRGIWHLPKPIARAFMVQLWAFFAWYCLYIYGSDWMGENVFGGSANTDNPDYDQYEKGVQAASLGYALMSVVTMAGSIFIPKACRRFGMRAVWAVCLCVMGVVMLCTLNVKQGQTAKAIFLLAVLGIPQAATFSIPWTVVTIATKDDQMDRGLYTCVFNMSQALMEVVVALIGGPVYQRFGGRVASVLAMGGIGALLAAVLCYFVIDPPESTCRDGDGESSPRTYGSADFRVDV